MSEDNYQDNSKHHQYHTKSSRFNIIPIIIIIGIIYFFFNYDIETLSKNKQLNKNISYLKDKVVMVISEIKSKFFQTENLFTNTIKSPDQFNLQNFLPQGINTNTIQNRIPTNTYLRSEEHTSELQSQR